MNMKSICTLLAGATVLYAGVLTLTDDLYIGTVMVLVGGIILALPIWKSIRKPAAVAMKDPKQRKRKTHLKVVEDQDHRPTYH